MSEDTYIIFEMVPTKAGVAVVRAAMKRCGLKNIGATTSGALKGFYSVKGSGTNAAASAYLALRWDISDWSKGK